MAKTSTAYVHDLRKQIESHVRLSLEMQEANVREHAYTHATTERIIRDTTNDLVALWEAP